MELIIVIVMLPILTLIQAYVWRQTDDCRIKPPMDRKEMRRLNGSNFQLALLDGGWNKDKCKVQKRRDYSVTNQTGFKDSKALFGCWHFRNADHFYFRPKEQEKKSGIKNTRCSHFTWRDRATSSPSSTLVRFVQISSFNLFFLFFYLFVVQIECVCILKCVSAKTSLWPGKTRCLIKDD